LISSLQAGEYDVGDTVFAQCIPDVLDWIVLMIVKSWVHYLGAKLIAKQSK